MAKSTAISTRSTSQTSTTMGGLRNGYNEMSYLHKISIPKQRHEALTLGLSIQRISSTDESFRRYPSAGTSEVVVVASVVDDGVGQRAGFCVDDVLFHPPRVSSTRWIPYQNPIHLRNEMDRCKDLNSVTLYVARSHNSSSDKTAGTEIPDTTGSSNCQENGTTQSVVSATVTPLSRKRTLEAPSDQTDDSMDSKKSGRPNPPTTRPAVSQVGSKWQPVARASIASTPVLQTTLSSKRKPMKSAAATVSVSKSTASTVVQKAFATLETIETENKDLLTQHSDLYDEILSFQSDPLLCLDLANDAGFRATSNAKHITAIDAPTDGDDSDGLAELLAWSQQVKAQNVELRAEIDRQQRIVDTHTETMARLQSDIEKARAYLSENYFH